MFECGTFKNSLMIAGCFSAGHSYGTWPLFYTLTQLTLPEVSTVLTFQLPLDVILYQFTHFHSHKIFPCNHVSEPNGDEEYLYYYFIFIMNIFLCYGCFLIYKL